MKKFGRFFSGIAAIMLGVGILMIVFGIKGAKAYWEKQDYSSNAENISYRMYAAEKIKMDIPFGIVEVGVSDNGEVQFFGRNIDKDSITFEEDQGELNISVKDQYKKIRLFNLDIPIFSGMDLRNLDRRGTAPVYKLLLPAWEYIGELDIKVDCGTISINSVWADRMKLEVSLGEIKVEEGAAENLELLCRAGAADIKGDFIVVDADVEFGDLELTLSREKEMYSGRLSGNIGDISYGVKDFYGNKRYYKYRGGFGIVRNEKFSGSGNGNVSLSCKIGNIKLWFSGDMNTVYQDAVAIENGDLWEGCLDSWETDNIYDIDLEISRELRGDWYGFQDDTELSEVLIESNPGDEAKQEAVLNIVNVLELYDWKKEKAVYDIMNNPELDDLAKGTAILEVLKKLNIAEEKMKAAAQIMLDDMDSQDWEDENEDVLYQLEDNSYWEELKEQLEEVLEDSELNDTEKREEVTNIFEVFEVGSFGGIWSRKF